MTGKQKFQQKSKWYLLNDPNMENSTESEFALSLILKLLSRYLFLAIGGFVAVAQIEQLL